MTYHNSRHPRSTRLGHHTGWLDSVKDLNDTTYQRVGHLWKQQYVYINILRAGTRHEGATGGIYQTIDQSSNYQEQTIDQNVPPYDHHDLRTSSTLAFIYVLVIPLK